MSISTVQILNRHKAREIADAVGANAGTVRMWRKRGRIPPEHWQALAAKGIATLDELAATLAREAA